MISSVHNPHVKAVAKLQRQGRERRRSGRFCIESERELSRALAAGFDVAELYYTDNWLTSEADRSAQVQRLRDAGAFITPVSDPVLAKIAYREHPQGFVAVLRARQTSLHDALQAAGAGGIVVCSGVEKPGNIGAILRSAAAAGVGAVLIDTADFDLFNPNCIRASTGAAFALPVACAPQPAVAEALRHAGRTLFALSPEAAEAYTAVDWRSPWAIVLGAEAEGLDPRWRTAADRLIAIPLASPAADRPSTVDSLNVSVAAAVVMFESRRQRDAG